MMMLPRDALATLKRRFCQLLAQPVRPWCFGVALAGLTACNAAEENVSNLARDIHGGYDVTRAQIANYIAPPATDGKSPHPKRIAYCYQLQINVMCYTEPQPILRPNLIGIQANKDGFEHHPDIYTNLAHGRPSLSAKAKASPVVRPAGGAESEQPKAARPHAPLGLMQE